MWPGLHQRVIKRCPSGHKLDPSWSSCPRCTGGEPNQSDSTDEAVRTIAHATDSGATRLEQVEPDWLLQLMIESGEACGKILEFKAGRWKLGRTPRPQEGYQLVPLPDQGMSRDHLTLEVGPAAILVRDLRTTNGTWVNGERVERSVLSDGDVLRLGETELRVRIRTRVPGR